MHYSLFPFAVKQNFCQRLNVPKIEYCSLFLFPWNINESSRFFKSLSKEYFLLEKKISGGRIIWNSKIPNSLNSIRIIISEKCNFDLSSVLELEVTQREQVSVFHSQRATKYFEVTFIHSSFHLLCLTWWILIFPFFTTGNRLV